MATHATVWSGILSQAAGTLAVGKAVVLSGDVYFVATSANRASYGRAVGVAKSAADGTTVRSFEYQVAGVLPASISGVGTGTAEDYVIVAADGSLTRTSSPSGSDDIIGVCPSTTGDVQITPCASASGGGGGGATLPIDLTTDVTGPLPAANRGAPAGVTYPELHGATGDGVADDDAEIEDVAADFNAASADDVALVLGARTYLVTGLDPWPMGLSLIGQGPSSVLKTTTNAGTIITRDTDAGDRAKSTLFAFFKILGDGKATGKTDQTGIENGRMGADGATRALVLGVSAKDTGGPAFVQAYSDDAALGPVNAVCRAEDCYKGAVVLQGSLIGFEVLNCTTGAELGGNANWIGGSAKGCTTALKVNAGGNDSHGLIVGVSLLHNTTAIQIGAVTNGEFFIGCRVYEGDINIDAGNTRFNTFVGCTIDATNYNIKGKTRWIGCTFDTNYFATVDDDGGDSENEFVECRGLDGTIPSFVGERVHVNVTFSSGDDITLTPQESWASVIDIDGEPSVDVNLFNTRTPSRGEHKQWVCNRMATETVNYFWATGDGIAVPPGKSALFGFNVDADQMICLALADNNAESVERPGGGTDPTSVDFDGLWLPDYSGAPWAGAASAGASAGRDLVTNGVDPDVGGAVNGYTPADFESGSPDELRIIATTAENFVTTTAYTVEMLIKPESAPADTTVYNNPGIVTETGGNWGIVHSDAGVSVYHASTTVGQVAASNGVWTHIVARFGLVSGELDIFVNGVLVDHNTGVAATGSVTGAALWIGANYAGTVNYDGQIMQLGLSRTAFSDVAIAGLYAFAKAKYPAMSLP